MEKDIRLGAESLQKGEVMSLLEDAFEEFTIINRTQEPDGYGGIITVWTDGAKITGALVLNSGNQVQIAQAMGVTSVYTLTVKRATNLDFHTVIRRESDKKIFRLTTDSDDKRTPNSATLDMRQYTAEEFTLPRGD